MDWNELNPDLLCVISKKLGDISNFVCFPSDLHAQLPWFVLEKIKEEIKFYSFNLNTTHTLQVPYEANMKTLVGATNNYLVLADNYDSVLVDPLVGSQIQVPYECVSIDDLCGIHSRSRVPNSTEGSICAAMFMIDHVENEDILFLVWLSGDGVWTKVEVPESYSNDPAVLYKGNLYVSDCETEVTRVVDITNGNVVSVISGQGLHFDYLIEAFEDLLGVVQLFDSEDHKTPIEECRFKVYRLVHSDNDIPSWVEMSKGIGDLILFLDDKSGSFCLKASDCDGFEGNNKASDFGGFTQNTIYFLKWNQKDTTSEKVVFVLGQYNLEKDEAQIIDVQDRFANGGTWYVPSL